MRITGVGRSSLLATACKLIPPIYVKPFLKRQKNDSNDAAAIVEAAQRPTMRFVAVKSEEAQADAMLFRTRALLVRQRTQTINSLRGQLAEFGVIAAQGVGSIAMLRFEWGAAKATLPEQVVPMTSGFDGSDGDDAALWQAQELMYKAWDAGDLPHERYHFLS